MSATTSFAWASTTDSIRAALAWRLSVTLAEVSLLVANAQPVLNLEKFGRLLAAT
jgi:hypothetical protein